MSDTSMESSENSDKRQTPSAKSSNGSTRKRNLRSGHKEMALAGIIGTLTLDQIKLQPRDTGLVYDERMAQPHCEWDPEYSERPERVLTSFQRCQDYGLVDRCVRVAARVATEDEILLQHSLEYHDTVKSSSTMPLEQLQSLSAKYDAVYFHATTYEAAMLAAGSAIELTERISNGELRNGMSICRPPGHHAQESAACGFCIFNNVALAATYAVDILNLQRVLIVDWDVHHGQGSQNMFYDDPRVMYFSIHRYEYGKFWPNLRESDYDHIGTGRGKGYNINVPFNKVGMTDADYLAIFQQILLPLATQFNPELILVSAGYDAAIGDAEGLSEITPTCYAHLTHMLMTLACGKIAVILEGGYCIKSQAESVALTLRTLLDEPCPVLTNLDEPLSTTKEVILHLIRVLRPYWKCFCFHEETEDSDELPQCFLNIEMPKLGIKFADESTISNSHETDDHYEVHTPEKKLELDKVIDSLINNTLLPKYPHRTCLVYDERMRKHRCRSGKEEFSTHPERPDRITRIYEKHQECGFVDRCKNLAARFAVDEEVSLVHGTAYIDRVKSFQHRSLEELHDLECTFASVYLSPFAYESASLATGCTLNVVDEVMGGRCRNGVAIVRPPGHHAEPHQAMGFCYFNSVAVAARYAQQNHGAQRVLILDWDVHHGNGTQHIFEDDPSVLYISLHRFDNGWFFPAGGEGDYPFVGINKGEGFNINIPWNNRSMADAEYLAAFQQIIMPVGYEFCPDLVLVSAGFDAAKGDPLGGYKVTPTGYGHMTHMLSSLAGGKVILVLEGGYNLNSISESMAACTSVLLGDISPWSNAGLPCDSAITTIRNVLDMHQNYWKSLRFRVKMPNRAATKEWLKSKSLQADNMSDASSVTDLNFKDDKSAVFDSSISSLPDGLTSLESSIASPSGNIDMVSPIRENIDQLTQNLSGLSVTESMIKQDLSDIEPPTFDPEASGDKLGSYELGLTSELADIKPSVSDPDFGVNASDSGIVVNGSSPSQPEDLVGACGGSDAPISSAVLQQEAKELFTVIPLPWCPHVKTVTPVPLTGLNTSAPCIECGMVGENWVCLVCYEVHCSRFVNEHMLMHGLETEHRMVLSYADLSVWCYACDVYVHNEAFFEAKRAAHNHKFGQDIPRH